MLQRGHIAYSALPFVLALLTTSLAAAEVPAEAPTDFPSPGPSEAAPRGPNSPREMSEPPRRSERSCRARWRMLEMRYCDLFFVPINLSAGAGFVFDSEAGRGAFFAGVDVGYFNYHALSWTAAEARVALYETCPNGDDSCSGQGSFFVGTRPGYAIALDRQRRHHVVFGAGLGWGQIGKGFRDRDPEAHGFVVSPSIRYAYRSAFGLDVHAFFPIYSGLGERYPMAISLTVTGVPTLILAAVMRIAR